MLIARELISDEIPPLKTSDTGVKALSWMEEFKVSHLPIVNNMELLGLITDADILDLNSPEEPLGSNKLSLIRPFIFEDDHFYEVVKLFNKFNLTLLPVLGKDEKFLGTISQASVVKAFSMMSAVNDPGGVIILEMNSHDYTLHEIARIVEGNDAKLLSVFITSHTDSTKIEVTLKINRSDLSPIIQTFERFDYTIKASFHQSEHGDDMKKKFDSFMNYLNI
jgi:acetoin utilization protein AcuB